MNPIKKRIACLHSFGSTTSTDGTWHTCFNCGMVISDAEKKMLTEPKDWYKEKVHQHFVVTIENITYVAFFGGIILGILIGKII